MEFKGITSSAIRQHKTDDPLNRHHLTLRFFVTCTLYSTAHWSLLPVLSVSHLTPHASLSPSCHICLTPHFITLESLSYCMLQTYRTLFFTYKRKLFLSFLSSLNIVCFQSLVSFILRNLSQILWISDTVPPVQFLSPVMNQTRTRIFLVAYPISEKIFCFAVGCKEMNILFRLLLCLTFHHLPFRHPATQLVIASFHSRKSSS